MLKHLGKLSDLLYTSGHFAEAFKVGFLNKMAQADDFDEFASDVMGLPSENRSERMSIPTDNGLLSFDLYNHPLAAEIRAYCERVAKVFPNDLSQRVGNTLPTAKEIDNIIDLATRYDNKLNIYGDWKDNPNLLDPVNFKKLVKYIAAIVYQRLDGDVSSEEYTWANDQLVDLYTDFYTEEYLGAEFKPEESEYSKKLQPWLDKNPGVNPVVLRALGPSYPPESSELDALQDFSEVPKQK